MQTQSAEPPVVAAAATMAICFYCFPDKIFSTDAIPFRHSTLVKHAGNFHQEDGGTVSFLLRGGKFALH